MSAVSIALLTITRWSMEAATFHREFRRTKTAFLYAQAGCFPQRVAWNKSC